MPVTPTTFTANSGMKFIRRADLPKELQKLYDYAAKGNPEDKKNNTALIDSMEELKEFEHLYQNLGIYQNAKWCFENNRNDMCAKIYCNVFDKIEKFKDEYNKRYDELWFGTELPEINNLRKKWAKIKEKQRAEAIKNAQEQLEKYKQEHPTLYRVQGALGWLSNDKLYYDYQYYVNKLEEAKQNKWDPETEETRQISVEMRSVISTHLYDLW